MKSRLLGAFSASLFAMTSIGTAHAVAISGQGTWESTLQGRDLDGNLATFEAYYDTALNITWLANAHYAGTPMKWSNANAWAAGLDPYGSGITGWRLPTTTDTGTSGCDYSTTGGTDCGYNVNTSTGEMASMFYSTLDNLAYYSTSGVANQPGWGLTNTGPFSNVQSYIYWSATEYAPITSYAGAFNFSNGNQGYLNKSDSIYAWAVHAGDVGASAVPVPAAVWLFGSGLLGLVGVSRKRRRKFPSASAGGTDCGYNVNTATGEMASMFYSTLGNSPSTFGVGFTISASRWVRGRRSQGSLRDVTSTN